MLLKNTACVLLLAGLAACSTTANLTYAPTTGIVASRAPRVASVTVTDMRDEHDPHYIGAIRGGLGNPLKTLTSTQPVKDEVTAAFTAALQARGLFGAGGSDTISVALKQLSANWYERREGHTTFDLTLSDASGRVLFQDQEDVLKIEGSVITLNAGVFASIDDLRAITMLSLNTAIDQAIDKPGFRAALGNP